MTEWITKKKKTSPWITKKKKTSPWITKKEKPTKWITKKEKSKSTLTGTDTTRGGGPDEGNVGYNKDMIYRHGERRKNLREAVEKLKKRPERTLKPYRAKKSVGGITKILRRLGKEIKKQPLPKKTKDLDKKFKKAFPHHDSAGKLKKAGGGRAIYKSGGAVMTGKKVGCQIK